MTRAPFIAAAAVVVVTSPAFAQLPGIGQIDRHINQVQKIADLNVSEQEERDLGERVSGAVRSEFGVLQDQELTKYISLIGNTLAKASKRPDLKWEFIVLDTDGVNAFAAPGGLVHITKGALGLMRNEAELAGVLGHEIAHITEKHSVESLRQNKGIKLLTDEAGSRTSYYYTMLADAVYDNIVEKGFDRGQENEGRIQPGRHDVVPAEADGSKQGPVGLETERSLFDASRYEGPHRAGDETDQEGKPECDGDG